jgi:radical SAM protein with 4Fe4S-binding SPASM domain
MTPLRRKAALRLFWEGVRARQRKQPTVAKALFHSSILVDSALPHPRRELETMKPRPADWPERVRYVILGTTGTCNASCIHCPTGKAETAHNPRTPMPMEIFRKIIDGIADYRLLVEGQIAFGLLGDGLVDPFVVERATYLRQRLPNVLLSINTNGAAFNRAKHAQLNEFVSVVSLHCESLDPATYDDLMRPLRAERVFPKFQEIFDAFPGKVDVSVPISRKNLHEAASIRDHFKSLGAHFVHFDALMSRCSEDRTIFDALSLAPQPIRCGPDIGDDLIVDCDGTVLQCCQDFQRIDSIGNLAEESFVEALQNVHRAKLRQQMAEGRHGERVTCSRCFADTVTPDFPFNHIR